MENWIYFVLIAQFLWAICVLIDKIVISKGCIKNPAVYIVLNGIMNVLLIFLLPFASFEPLKFTDFLIALLAGIMLSASVIVYYKAVHYDEISRIKVMEQITPVFVLILSFLIIGEVLTKSHIAGFLLLIGAGLIVSYRKEKNSIKLSKAFYLMLVSAFLASLYYVSAKHIFSITGFWSAFLWLRLASFSALLVLFSKPVKNQFIETFRSMPNKIKGLLGFKIVIDFSAFIFSGYAVLNGPISLVTVLGSSILPLFVFAFILFTSICMPDALKEAIDKKAVTIKLLAVILIIIGIAFINS